MTRSRRRLLLVAGIASVLVAITTAVWWRSGSSSARSAAPDDIAERRRGAARSMFTEAVSSRETLALTPIAGHVTDAAGPVAGATVELSRGALGALPIVVREVKTDTAGHFDLGAHPLGRYVIAARASGRAPSAVAADLRSPVEAAKWRDAHIKLEACAAEVAISVVDSDAAPIASAAVVVSEPGGARVSLGSTNANGLLTACAPSGTWTLAVAAPGWAVAYRTLELREKLAETFVLQREVVARGALVDSVTGNVVAVSDAASWCQVWAVPLAAITSGRGAPPLMFGVCASDGTFEIRGLAPGGYNLFATTDSHATDRPVAIQLAAGGDDEYSIPMSPRTQLEGVLVDEQSRKLGGQYVYAKAQNNARSRTVVTRADGSFRIELVPAGELTFVVEGRQVRSPTSWSATSAARLEIVVGSGARVTGRVESAGTPARAVVSLETARGRRDVTTAADGTFTFDDVLGRIVISARRDAETSAGITLDVEPGTTHDITLELATSLRIDGRVISRRGDPLPGLWLRGQCVGAPLVEASAQTASDGRFRMSVARQPECTAVRFHAVAAARGHMVAETDPAEVVLTGEDASMTVVLTLRDAARLRARVLDPGGTPVPGASVTVRNAVMGAEPRLGSTDQTGVATISALLPGWYSVTAADASGRQATRDVEISSDRTVDLTIRSDATLVIRERDNDGAWTLWVVRWPSLNVVTEQPLDAGSETVLRVLPADYLVMAQRGPATLFARSLRVREGQESTIDLSLANARTVQVALAEFWGRPIAAPLVCRVVPRAMIDSLVPLLSRVRPAPMSSPLHASVIGDDLLAWCVGNPAMVSDGVGPMNAAQSRVTVAVPDVTREPGYLVRKGPTGHVIERVLRSAGTLRVGDVVVSIDGRPVSGLSALGLGYALVAAPPGVHSVGVLRDGESIRATLCIEACGSSE